MPERYLTVKEAAERLRVHDRTVRAMLRDGRLKKYTLKTPKSHRVRLDACEVEALVEDQGVPA
jgi:excisionase family DNA binding protein